MHCLFNALFSNVFCKKNIHIISMLMSTIFTIVHPNLALHLKLAAQRPSFRGASHVELMNSTCLVSKKTGIETPRQLCGSGIARCAKPRELFSLICWEVL